MIMLPKKLRSSVRYGVSRLRLDQRYPMGIIFPDAI